MRQQWEKLVGKVDAMSLRERALIFSAAAFLLISLVDTLFLNPLLAKQKKLSDQVMMQQEKMKEIRAQLETLLQAGKTPADSPLRKQLNLTRQRIADNDAYLQGLREHLVAPEKMAGLLQEMLKKDGQLELVSLQTLPATPLLAEKGAKSSVSAEAGKQVYAHRVKLTVRGSYAGLLQYLTNLEHLPMQLFWGEVTMKSVQYPSTELTLTFYTLSLDSTWLQI